MDESPSGRGIFSSQKIWAVLLVADSFFVILFGGALAATVYEHWQSAQPSVFNQIKNPAAVSARASQSAAAAQKPKEAAQAQPIQPIAPPNIPAQSKTLSKTVRTLSRPGKAVPITFEIKAAHARNVRLIGAFLIHDGGKKSMIRKPKGLWVSTLYLMPGTYRYYFLIDGKKKEDPANSKRNRGASILLVSPR
ncbi:MAG: early set domain-containing protein [Elusimicrobiota bacterium]